MSADASGPDRSLAALLVAALALLVALLDPVVHVERRLHRQLLVLDITQSMNAVDDPSGPAPPTPTRAATGTFWRWQVPAGRAARPCCWPWVFSGAH